MASPVAHDDEGWSGPRVVRTTPCRGHAFGEELLCPCGTTWSEHQTTPRRCPLGAQRCKRAAAAVPDGTDRAD